MNRIRPLAAIFLTSVTLIAIPAVAQDTAKGTGRPDRETQRRAVFDRLDTNKDGFVDKDESKAARLALFERLDANKDGKLTTDELTIGRRGRGQGPKGQSGDVNAQTGATPPAPPATQQGPRQGRRGGMFQRLDTDKDGAVSRVEWMAADDTRFDRLDANKDGKLAFGEFRFTQGGRKRSPAPAQ
ncbi:MAG TPA: hypothetical protein VJ890_10660 [Vineibacter sp.]|nr:hypothetical protein [Vineibacter sp.]